MKNEKKETQLWGIASTILGSISIIIILMPYFGLPLAITGIVFSNLQKKRKKTAMATAGLITSIIGTVLNGITVFVLVIYLLVIGMV